MEHRNLIAAIAISFILLPGCGLGNHTTSNSITQELVLPTNHEGKVDMLRNFIWPGCTMTLSESSGSQS